MNTDNENAPESPNQGPGKNRDIFSSIYYAFNSIKLTVFLFITLGLVSIIGTIIEQGAEPSKYAEIYSEETIRLFNALGLFDMYHTFWFFTLLLLLVLNLTVCTIERLPRVWRFARDIKPVLEEGDENKHPFRETLQVQGGAGKVEQTLKGYAKFPVWMIAVDLAAIALAIFFVRQYKLNFLEFVAFIIIPLLYVVVLNFRGKVLRSEDNGTVYFFLNQWLLSRFGVYIVHISTLLIFVGAIMGSLFGFKGFMAITEGETLNQMFVREHRMVDSMPRPIAALFGGGEATAPHESREYKTLPFAIRCDDFSIEYYPDTGRPKDYTSDLVVIRDGQEVTRKTIEVNDPLIVDDIFFYQSSYGQSRRPGQVVLSVTQPGGEAQQYRTRLNGKFRIDGTAVDVQVTSFVPDFTIVNGRITQRSQEMINPAVYITAKNNQKALFNGWIFPNYPEHSVETGDFKFEFVDYWGGQYTGLQVAYDPGVETVWIGCSLMVVGLLISFFHSHQRVWARVHGNQVVLAASTHKNRMAFEKKFNHLTEQLSKE